ncbi:hypothetical protein [Mycobacterium paraseoulense]|uniref:Uncharacterized protein n=1 Tax=Mycobacterium paraseoulense TaxID=590652 RepID=A0A1X0IFE1_9MYCO|nr:hypothetical protein [Mycobacterium paraseoulense]MCV7398044.1 hypothetical protein [Mycobacterium paraseoulense]ORB45572.1 hypothetical protein BST39_05085 [Mycobacterium paraseoulense]BBZ70717.1 hypothetical protein MPRS_18100 [Mycobacterium paraseoulense]
MFGKELAQLGLNDGTGVAEELFAGFEQFGGDLFGCNTEMDIGIGRIGCVGGIELICIEAILDSSATSYSPSMTAHEPE